MTAVVASTPVTRRGRKHQSLIPSLEEIFVEGVFFKLDRVGSLSRQQSKMVKSSNPKSLQHSETSVSTFLSTTNTTPCASPLCSAPNSWRSTDTPSFILHQPLMVSDPDQNGESDVVPDEAEKLGQVMTRSRKLPGTWYFSSNHVMVNQERTQRVMRPLCKFLTRSGELLFQTSVKVAFA